MAQSASIHPQTRPSQEASGRDRRLETGFKPLALPALAAAVQMSRRTTRRATAERDIPAILREDALVG